jgi:hypothetical protein
MPASSRFHSTLRAAWLGVVLAPRAQPADPFADNSFPVPYQQAPVDPALHGARFQSCVGTYLPTDPYHYRVN